MAGLKRPTVTEVFNGQSCLILFEEVSDYSKATVDTIVGDGQDLGQILNGSTEWTGENASFDNVTDEQGDIIVANPTNGTFGMDFFMADFSAEKMMTFMHARKITLSNMGNTAFSEASEAYAVGDTIAVIERPIALVNDTSNKAIFFPKARIVTSVSKDGQLVGLKASCVAQDCTTSSLGTMMYIPKHKLQYREEEEEPVEGGGDEDKTPEDGE